MLHKRSYSETDPDHLCEISDDFNLEPAAKRIKTETELLTIKETKESEEEYENNWDAAFGPSSNPDHKMLSDDFMLSNNENS